MPISLRPGPRLAANQYAKARVDLYLIRKFFEGLLVALIDRDNRNILKAVDAARQVPAKLREAKDLAKSAVRSWASLNALSGRPDQEYKAALGRGADKLGKSPLPERQQRGQAYATLASGSFDTDLGQIEDELEEFAQKIQERIQEHREEKQAERQQKVSGYNPQRFPRRSRCWD